MASVSVKVPATTANLGPGYDCMGIALQIYNTVTVRKAKSSAPPHPMVEEAAAAFFAAARKRPFRFAWKIDGEVPKSRGLGSSVTLRLGILHGLNDLAGSPLDRDQLFHLCAKLEGHPDNAGPAAYGGFTLTAPGCGIQRYRVETKLEFVLLIPDFEILTDDARTVLPKTIPFRDAVFSAAHAAVVAGAFASRDYARLAGAFGDRIHQPARSRFVPFLDKVISAGMEAGALGGWLSGSGSTIACLTLGDPEPVAAAMLSASGLQHATAYSARADNAGVRVTSAG
jgi:homoserine kinase